MADIPDTTDTSVAKIAVAWMIAKEGFNTWIRAVNPQADTDIARVDKLVEFFNRAYHGLMQQPKGK